MSYPTLEKMKEVQHLSQEIGEFLEWLGTQRIDLCSLIPGVSHDRWAPVTEGREHLLARYFDVDLVEAERERRAILASFQRESAQCNQQEKSK